MDVRALLTAARVRAEDVEQCAAFLVPGSQALNLRDIEIAQAAVHQIHAMRGARLGHPLGSEEACEACIGELVAAFGRAVLACPTLAQQRQHPH